MVIKLSVTGKVLFLLISISLITIFFSFIIGMPLIDKMGDIALNRSEALGNAAVNDSSMALYKSAQRELLTLAKDKASIADMFFAKTEGETRSLAYSAKNLEKESYPGRWDLKTVYGNPKYLNNTSLIHFSPGADKQKTEEEIQYLSGMPPFFFPLLSVDPDIDSLYIGTSTGLYLESPWNSDIPVTYDPRNRPWFKNALYEDNLTWSDPYVGESTGDLMITCSIPVRFDESGYFWVIGNDITVNTINSLITGSEFAGGGYSFLVDRKGNIIARPGLSASNIGSNDLIGNKSFSSSNAELQNILSDMTKGNSGVQIISLFGVKKVIAYAPVKTTGWSIGIVMPVSDIVKPVLATEEHIRDETNQTAIDISRARIDIIYLYSTGSLTILIIVLIVALFFSRYITRPLNLLMETIRIIGKGNLNQRVNLKTGDEFEEVGNLFNAMCQDLTAAMESLAKTTAEKERYSTELEIAREIQRSFLPEILPKVSGLDIAASSIMAREVGGDFFDIYPFEQAGSGKKRLSIIIADVSGKGVSAALFMALSRIVIRVNTVWHTDPAEVITHSNRIISNESRLGMFVTVFFSEYDSETKTLQYINAGHNPPFLLRGDKLIQLTSTGPAVGCICDSEYHVSTISLEENDLIVFYTDGVTEAVNTELELFGEEKLIRVIKECKDYPVWEIHDTLLSSITSYAGPRPQEDDITLIVIKVKNTR